MSEPGSTSPPTTRSASTPCPTAWSDRRRARSRRSGSATGRCRCARRTQALLGRAGRAVRRPTAWTRSWPPARPSGLTVRAAITAWLTDDGLPRRDRAAAACRWPSVQAALPFAVADYVDFYASENHAEQRRADLPAGRRPADPELEAPADRLPRPGRHRRGRRGTEVRRPNGQRKVGDDDRVRPVAAAGHRGRGRLRGRRRLALGTRCRSANSPSTCSAWCCSTTGRPATSRPGSTCRSGRSSASRSPPRSRPGSPRWRRWQAARVPGVPRDPQPLPYLDDDRRLRGTWTWPSRSG